MSLPQRILIVRNDKLGDFTLSLPSFQVLRRALPESELVAFVPEYTRAVAQLCPAIDRICIDPGADQLDGRARRLAQNWREDGYDAVIALYSTARVALAGFLARIPDRVAPATKAFQFLYNSRLTQRRSESIKPEYAYNVDLVTFFLRKHGIVDNGEFARPVIELDQSKIDARRARLCATAGFDPELPLVFAHPGHGGSSASLGVEQYERLLNGLRSKHGHSIVLTVGTGELEKARAIYATLENASKYILESREGLSAFCEILACADLFLGSSTGPLHISGALDRPTAGFYVRRRTSSALRWQTLNSPERRLAFSPPDGPGEYDLTGIDMEAAAQEISQRFLLS